MTNQGPLAGIQDYLGIGELWFELDEREMRMLRIACVLPLLALLTLLGTFLLELFHDSNFQSLDFWDRLGRWFTVTEVPLIYAGLGGLFVFGIGRISYAQGSWAFAIAVSLIPIGFAAGMYASLVVLLSDSAFNFDGSYHLNTALSLAHLSGIFAVGFGFLAFRGLSAGEPEWEEYDDDEGEEEG